METHPEERDLSSNTFTTEAGLFQNTCDYPLPWLIRELHQMGEMVPHKDMNCCLYFCPGLVPPPSDHRNWHETFKEKNEANRVIFFSFRFFSCILNKFSVNSFKIQKIIKEKMNIAYNHFAVFLFIVFLCSYFFPIFLFWRITNLQEHCQNITIRSCMPLT